MSRGIFARSRLKTKDVRGMTNQPNIVLDVEAIGRGAASIMGRRGIYHALVNLVAGLARLGDERLHFACGGAHAAAANTVLAPLGVEVLDRLSFSRTDTVIWIATEFNRWEAVRHPGLVRVAFIHDLVPVLYPKLVDDGTRKIVSSFIDFALQQMSFFICVSEHTRSDLCLYGGIDSRRTFVLPWSVAEFFTPVPDGEERRAVLRRHGLDDGRPYFLAVGALEHRKNLLGLLSAYGQYRRAAGDAPARLILVGPPGYGFQDIRAAMMALDPEQRDIRHLGYVADADMPALYSGCRAFAMVSHAEGFGLPLLEAMSCGAPVVTACTTSLREVAGPAGVQLHPFDVVGIARALTRMDGDADLRAQQSVLSLESAARFGAARTTATFAAIMETLRRTVAG